MSLFICISQFVSVSVRLYLPLCLLSAVPLGQLEQWPLDWRNIKAGPDFRKIYIGVFSHTQKTKHKEIFKVSFKYLPHIFPKLSCPASLLPTQITFKPTYFSPNLTKYPHNLKKIKTLIDFPKTPKNDTSVAFDACDN